MTPATLPVDGAVLVVALVILSILIVAVLAVSAYVAYARSRFRSPGTVDRPAQEPASVRRIGEFDLHVRVIGQDCGATAVLVVHGGPGHSHLSFKRAFDFLAEDRLLVEYDQRGSGLSQCRQGTRHYTATLLVHEIDAVRLEVLDADRIILIGHSAGGALAQRYAITYPEQVDRLILVGSTLANGGQSPGWLWRWAGPALYSIQLGFPPADADTADEWFTRQVHPDELKRLYDPSRVDILQDCGPNTFTTWLAVSSTLAGGTFADELAHLDVPTLIVFGPADSVHTGKRAAQQLHSLIPRSRLAEIPQSGHWPFAENPTAFQAVIREFLAEPAEPLRQSD